MITTIILLVSRDSFLSEVFSSLEMLACDASYTNLLVIVDGNIELYQTARQFTQSSKFNDRLCVQYSDPKPVKKFDVLYRRHRIASLHNFAKQYIGIASYVLLVEDDTVVPKHALESLAFILDNSKSIAMAEGAELGRWGIPYIGAWRFDDIYDPKEVTSLVFANEGIEMIDAGGFYCALIRAEIYKEYDFNLYELLGPDISMGLYLRQNGYQNYIDWSVQCKHLNIDHKGNRQVFLASEGVKPLSMVRKKADNWVIKY